MFLINFINSLCFSFVDFLNFEHKFPFHQKFLKKNVETWEIWEVAILLDFIFY